MQSDVSPADVTPMMEGKRKTLRENNILLQAGDAPLIDQASLNESNSEIMDTVGAQMGPVQHQPLIQKDKPKSDRRFTTNENAIELQDIHLSSARNPYPIKKQSTRSQREKRKRLNNLENVGLRYREFRKIIMKRDLQQYISGNEKINPSKDLKMELYEKYKHIQLTDEPPPSTLDVLCTSEQIIDYLIIHHNRTPYQIWKTFITLC